MADKIMKRNILIIACLLTISIHTLMMIRNVYILLLTRFLTGIPTAILITTIPTLVAEIVPKNKIGLFGGIYHLFLPLGITVAFQLGVLLPTK